LQQHPTRQLQAPPLQETFGGHYFAPGHAIQIRRYAFNLINACQSLREWTVVINRHDSNP
jgi:hypothetical protein